MVPGEYKPAWSMDQVIAALHTRDAVLRDNPQDAAECATRFLETTPELRGMGGFDVIEAQANRFLGRYEAAITPKRGARLR